MTSEHDATQREAAVRRYWGEIWSKGRFDLAGEFYAPSYRENLEPTTPAQFAAGAATWAAHFEGFRVDIDELIAVGNRVVTRVTYRARHTGDFKRLPARGRSCEVPGIDIFEFEDGRVVQHWHATDHLELFRQLGGELTDATPAFEPASAPAAEPAGPAPARPAPAAAPTPDEVRA